jgi:hypothetical protein
MRRVATERVKYHRENCSSKGVHPPIFYSYYTSYTYNLRDFLNADKNNLHRISADAFKGEYELKQKQLKSIAK